MTGEKLSSLAVKDTRFIRPRLVSIVKAFRVSLDKVMLVGKQ